jgi:hypothetical protein
LSINCVCTEDKSVSGKFFVTKSIITRIAAASKYLLRSSIYNSDILSYLYLDEDSDSKEHDLDVDITEEEEEERVDGKGLTILSYDDLRLSGLLNVEEVRDVSSFSTSFGDGGDNLYGLDDDICNSILFQG